MTKQELADKIQEFLDGGGEITRLRYASEKDQKMARRREYHVDKAYSGSDRSKKIIESQDKKESEMIFSRDERWKEAANE